MVPVLAFVAALVVGSFLEYLGHRLMHLRWVLGHRHIQHHVRGWGQGVLGEFRDYLYGLPVVGWFGFLHSVEAGVAFAVGTLVYAFFAGYSHQLNHERPELVFWMPRPVHHLHHARQPLETQLRDQHGHLGPRVRDLPRRRLDAGEPSLRPLPARVRANLVEEIQRAAGRELVEGSRLRAGDQE